MPFMCRSSTGFQPNASLVELGAWPVRFVGGRLGAEKKKKNDEHELYIVK